LWGAFFFVLYAVPCLPRRRAPHVFVVCASFSPLPLRYHPTFHQPQSTFVCARTSKTSVNSQPNLVSAATMSSSRSTRVSSNQPSSSQQSTPRASRSGRNAPPAQPAGSSVRGTSPLFPEGLTSSPAPSSDRGRQSSPAAGPASTPLAFNSDAFRDSSPLQYRSSSPPRDGRTPRSSGLPGSSASALRSRYVND